MCVFVIMSKGADTDATTTTWSTWEELLLAFAVKRHGLKDWDTVAMELQNRHRSSLPSNLFTAQICKDRYRYLRQRFTNHLHHHRNDDSTGGSGPVGGVRTDNNDLPSAVDSDAEDINDALASGGDDAESLPWLEELRKIRVAELKREVQRYDLSIESLQMKVKTMEEEREKSLSENQNGAVKQPDLDEEIKKERSESDNKHGDEDSPGEAAGKTVSAEDENRSFNESNSTENRRGDLKTEPEPEREPVVVKPDSDSKPVGEEDSCNDSSDRHEVGKAKRKREKDGVDSDELRDSVSDSKEGTKDSSDVQSSASLMTRKRRRKDEVDGGGGGVGGSGGGEGATVVSPANGPINRESGGAVKSEPLLELLDNIRSHKHGSVFEGRLESQKTDKYKNMIRQHVDLETVQARIDNGSYSSCSTRFYVDLLLLFNNAIVFFPKSSIESLAACELRQIVMKELKKNSAVEPSPESLPMRVQPKPDPEKPDSLLSQHKSTAPIIVCRKRSSIQAKTSSSVNKAEKQGEDKPVTNSKPLIKSPLSTSNEEESSMKLKMKEKPVTGVRSMRRSSKGRPNTSNSQSAPSSNQNPSSSSQQAGTTDKGQAAKVDKKKAEEAATVKKRGAADFLKRIKKNDPSKGTLVEALKSSGDSFKGGKRDQPTKKSDERKDVQARRSNGSGGGSGGGKRAKEESSPSKRNVGRPPKRGKDAVVGKRGRESGEGEGSSKRSKKRTRR